MSLIITVGEPRKRKDFTNEANRVNPQFAGSFVEYKVTVKTGERNSTVFRRFRDFKFLNDSICRRIPGAIIPILPDSSIAPVRDGYFDSSLQAGFLEKRAEVTQNRKAHMISLMWRRHTHNPLRVKVTYVFKLIQDLESYLRGLVQNGAALREVSRVRALVDAFLTADAEVWADAKSSASSASWGALPTEGEREREERNERKVSKYN